MSTRTNKALGGIAGAVALAAGSQAYGISLITAPANLASTVGTTTTVTLIVTRLGTRGWDVNGDAANDFVFTFRYPNTATGSGVVWQGAMAPPTANGNGVVGYQGAFVPYATNLSFGQNVGPTPPAGASFRTTTQTVLASQYRSNGIPSG